MEFVKQLSDQTLEKLIPFRTTRVSLAHLMQHLANHSTYHRGQITLMLRQLGAEPLPRIFACFSWRLRPWLVITVEIADGRQTGT